MTISVLLMTVSFSQNSFASGDYDLLHQWGSYGPTEPNNFAHPQFVGVGEDGSIYVSDFGNKRIQKFSSNGEYVTHWGNSGKQVGDFYNPSGIAVGGDFVFVADRDLNRIQKFSLDGEFIQAWGKKGVAQGQFMYPSGIAASNGSLYVIDTGNQRIQIFSYDGEFVSSFGSSGLGPGQFLNVVGIDVDNEGNVYVTDKGNHKIEKFTSDGEFVQSFAFYYLNYVFSPEAIAIDPLGGMFVVNSADGRILHLSQNSDLLLGLSDQRGPYPNSFEHVTDIAMGSNGELLVIDSPTHTIQSYETTFFELSPEFYFVAPVEEPQPAEDQTKPEIIAPNSLIVDADDFITQIDIGNAIATDESGIKTIINNAPEGFKPGINNVIWIAFDNAGHSSSAYQTITVKTCGHAYSDYNIIEGTSGDDVISGTDGDDLIFGLSGNDLISGGLGNDCIFGGSGDDIISGDGGNDVIKGNSGNDILKGQSGTDILVANSGSDVLDGGENSDRCYFDSEKDLLLNCE
jgi:sugar lactone lactonase YvrE